VLYNITRAAICCCRQPHTVERGMPAEAAAVAAVVVLNLAPGCKVQLTSAS
jgi:hypothetical protein